ncbi:MAG: beta-galactosidase [Thermoflexales bacterium]
MKGGSYRIGGRDSHDGPTTHYDTPINRHRLLVLLQLAALLGLASLARPPVLLVRLGPQQQVSTRMPIAGVHTRFSDEVEEWKVQRGLAMVREMGAAWVVEFFPWAYAEPAPGRYDWAAFDRIINHANRQGLTVIARLGFVPLWAREKAIGKVGAEQTTVTFLPPALYDDFATFAAAFARHYAGQVKYFQVWNEPNLALEWGMQPVDPAGYVAMLQQVYPAIKAANPDSVVLGGALAPTLEPEGSAGGLNDLVYLERIYTALGGGPRPWDGLAIHAYGFDRPPGEAPAADRLNFRRVEQVREIMRAHGDAGDVHITEAGWNDDPRWPRAVTPAKRIAYTLGAWDWASEHWVWVKSVSMWVFKLPAPARNYRDRFTFVTPSLEPLPIYEEIRKALVEER